MTPIRSMSTSTDKHPRSVTTAGRAPDRTAQATPSVSTPSGATSVNESLASRPRDLSMESFSAFTEVLGHRMGNLLSGIEGYTDLLLPVLQQSEDRENAFRILEGVSRMNGILKDLRHYQEALYVRTHLIEAGKILSGLMPLLADSEAARMRIETSIPAGTSVSIDERLIRQALLSIVRNAFDALPTTHESVSLRADVLETEGVVRFRIHSSATIESDEIRNRLFEPFFTTKSANLGLGLTMAKRIFQAHGGDVVLSTAEHEMGTEFSCTMPLSR